MAEDKINVHSWRLLFGICVGLIATLKIIAIIQLDLFGDEAFYWQCAQRPAWGYVDLPAMTAMLVKVGTSLWGDSTWGVRFVFFLVASAIPLLVWDTTRVLFNQTSAWAAATVALAIPGLGVMGLVAIPDAVVLAATAAFWLALTRALTDHRLRWWCLLGGVTAIGFATHYRFVTAPAACCLILLWPDFRHHLRTPGPWLAGLIACIGLVPALIVNLQTGFEPLQYFLAGRHGEDLALSQLGQHLAEQMALVTPLLYVILIGLLIGLLRGAFGERHPDQSTKWDPHRRARLLAPAAALPLLLYFLASPLHDTGPLTVHWPLVGYIPLLPAAGAWLVAKVHRKAKALPRWTAISALGLGLLVLLILLLDLAFGLFAIPGLRQPFTGYSELAASVSKRLETLPTASHRRPVVIADHYKTGANLEFLLHDRIDIFILDHSKNYMHGRQRQFDRWGIGETGLWQQAGRHALLVIDVNEIPGGHEQRWMDHIREFFATFEADGTTSVPVPGEPNEPDITAFYLGLLQAKNW